MQVPRIAVGICCLGLIPLLVGCGDNGRPTVQGAVTLDGKPVDTGSIAFRAVDGKSPTVGAFISRGRFRQQVPAGSMRVEITSSVRVGKKMAKSLDGSPIEIDVIEEQIPEHYNRKSTLVLDVKPGVNQIQYDLKSTP